MNAAIVTVSLNPAIDHTVAVADFMPGRVNRALWERIDPGGKGVNVAAFLADLGHSVSVAGLLGAENSDPFTHLFAEKNINDCLVRIPGRTRSNIKIVEPAGAQVTDINFPGISPSAPDLQQLYAQLALLAGDHEWFILTGSLPAKVSDHFYADTIYALKKAGRRVALDGSGPALAKALAAKPDLIKPNVLELEEALGRPLHSTADLVRTARELVQTGIGLVVLSMAEKGALFVDSQRAFHAQSSVVDVQTTVGAGDAMLAGTVSATCAGLALDDTARMGTACALAALQRVGPNLPALTEIRKLAEKVHLQEITF